MTPQWIIFILWEQGVQWHYLFVPPLQVSCLTRLRVSTQRVFTSRVWKVLLPLPLFKILHLPTASSVLFSKRYFVIPIHIIQIVSWIFMGSCEIERGGKRGGQRRAVQTFYSHNSSQGNYSIQHLNSNYLLQMK